MTIKNSQLNLYCLFLIILTLYCATGFRTRSRIIGGQSANLGDFPYQVLFMTDVGNGYSEVCGGSIITETVVVTAAHCVVNNSAASDGSTNNVDSMRIKAGNIYLNVWSSNQQIKYVKKAIVHPEYDSDIQANDIAILILSSPFEFDQYVSSIRLPCENFSYNKALCNVSGWGKTSTEDDSDLPDTLQYVEINTITNSNCQWTYNDLGIQILDSQVCTFTTDKDSCQGDSGGPVACNYQFLALAGIVSKGIGCASSFPGINTRVSKYVPYIQQVVYEETGNEMVDSCSSSGSNTSLGTTESITTESMTTDTSTTEQPEESTTSWIWWLTTTTDDDYATTTLDYDMTTPDYETDYPEETTDNWWFPTTDWIFPTTDWSWWPTTNAPVRSDQGPPLALIIGLGVVAGVLSLVLACLGALFLVARYRPEWLSESVTRRFGPRSEKGLEMEGIGNYSRF